MPGKRGEFLFVDEKLFFPVGNIGDPYSKRDVTIAPELAAYREMPGTEREALAVVASRKASRHGAIVYRFKNAGLAGSVVSVDDGNGWTGLELQMPVIPEIGYADAFEFQDSTMRQLLMRTGMTRMIRSSS